MKRKKIIVLKNAQKIILPLMIFCSSIISAVDQNDKNIQKKYIDKDKIEEKFNKSFSNNKKNRTNNRSQEDIDATITHFVTAVMNRDQDKISDIFGDHEISSYEKIKLSLGFFKFILHENSEKTKENTDLAEFVFHHSNNFISDENSTEVILSYLDIYYKKLKKTIIDVNGLPKSIHITKEDVNYAKQDEDNCEIDKKYIFMSEYWNSKILENKDQ